MMLLIQKRRTRTASNTLYSRLVVEPSPQTTRAFATSLIASTVYAATPKDDHVDNTLQRTRTDTAPPKRPFLRAKLRISDAKYTAIGLLPLYMDSTPRVIRLGKRLIEHVRAP